MPVRDIVDLSEKIKYVRSKKDYKEEKGGEEREG